MLETTLCYIDRGDALLLLHRTGKKDDVNAGKWLGIGGKLEPGESPEACLLREVREETGLTLTEYEYRGIVDFQSDGWSERMHLYTATETNGELTACDEGILSWVMKDKVKELPMWEGDRVFFQLLKDGEPFFHLKLSYDGEKLVGAELNGAALRL